MTEELKPLPCPFCGHDDIAVDLLGGRTRVWCHESCYASVTDIDTDRAVETWNTRSPAWRDIESAPKGELDEIEVRWLDGTGQEYIAIAWFDDGRNWDEQGFAMREEAAGWWHYTNSLTQVKIEPDPIQWRYHEPLPPEETK